jgi:hypothetical protein
LVNITSDVAGLANAAAENRSQRMGLHIRILHALQAARMCEARRVIIKYAHLLPDGAKPADILPFIASDQTHLSDAVARSLGNE